MSLGKTRQFNRPPPWFTPIGISSFSLSLAVNAIFSGLLVYKIAKTSMAFQHSFPRNTRGRHHLQHLLSMLIESGIVLFVVQLLWVLLFSLHYNSFYLLGGPIAMIYVRVLFLLLLFLSTLYLYPLTCLSFFFFYKKGYHTDNDRGTSQNGRCQRYSDDVCGKQHPVCVGQ